MAVDGAEQALQAWVRGRHRHDGRRSDELLGRAEPALRRIVTAELRGYGLAPQDRDEAINRILLRVWRWQPKREELTWPAFRNAISTITRRDLHSWLKSRPTRDARWTTFLTDTGIAPSGSPDPLEAIAETERAASVLGRLANLEDTGRRILILRYAHGLSYAALAEATGIPAASIGRRLADTLKRLRRNCRRDAG